MVELHIISNILKSDESSIPIVIYDEFENIIGIYDNGIIFNLKYKIGDEKIVNKYKENKNNINIKFEFAMKNLISNFRVIFYK